MRIGVALGSNLGDRLAHMQAGRDLLVAAHRGPGRPKISRAYETEPVGCTPGTPPFLNAVIEIETGEEPAVLREKLAALEVALGRPEARAKNAPRALDLDILYAGDRRSDDPRLLLPHPEARTRRFVLQPLADICPDLILPGETRTVSGLLSELPENPSVRLLHLTW